jgi:hypothetical protein
MDRQPDMRAFAQLDLLCGREGERLPVPARGRGDGLDLAGAEQGAGLAGGIGINADLHAAAAAAQVGGGREHLAADRCVPLGHDGVRLEGAGGTAGLALGDDLAQHLELRRVREVEPAGEAPAHLGADLVDDEG